MGSMIGAFITHEKRQEAMGKSNRKIVWVNSYKDIYRLVPTTAQLDASLTGYYYEPTNTIYLIRGKSREFDKHHEIYHSIHHHSEHPKSPAEFINREIGANVYSYNKVKQPRQILGKLRGFYNDLRWGEYKVGRRQALSFIKQALVKAKAPKTWMDDYKLLVQEVENASK